MKRNSILISILMILLSAHSLPASGQKPAPASDVPLPFAGAGFELYAPRPAGVPRTNAVRAEARPATDEI